MKKALIIFLTFIYLVVASGMAINLHYCGGKISSVSLWKKEKDDCCGKKKMKKKNCCKEKTSVLKIKDTQYSSTSLKTPPNTIKTIDACFAYVSFKLNKNFGIKITSTVHAPPNIYQNPIYLQYRILII